MSRLTQIAIALLLCGVAAMGQAALRATDFDPNKARGTATEVVGLDDPTQSYWVYLPSGYTADRRWPIVYVFDPMGRGKTAVEVYRSAAEKYGYIVAGSNNSRNGEGDSDMAAARAMWHDTHRRFAINNYRTYTTGMSGGARVATAFALFCANCDIAGVIAQAATYPQMQQPAPKAANEHFLYYITVGDQDFNYAEIVVLRKKKDEAGERCKVRMFSGDHGWAPPDAVEDALAWLQLKAMQMETEKRDPAFLEQMWEKAKSEATAAEQRGDALAEYYALRSLVEDFKGLEDTSTFAQKVAELKTSKAFKDAQHAEQQESEKQDKLTGHVLDQMEHVGVADSEAQIDLRQQIAVAMADLRRRAKSDSRDHLVYMRAYLQLLAAGIETGEDALRANDVARAQSYFELMNQVAPDQPGPMLRLAEVYARNGNKKAALKELEQAVQHGMKYPESITQNPEFQSLASDPEFQRIVKTLTTK